MECSDLFCHPFTHLPSSLVSHYPTFPAFQPSSFLASQPFSFSLFHLPSLTASFSKTLAHFSSLQTLVHFHAFSFPPSQFRLQTLPPTSNLKRFASSLQPLEAQSHLATRNT